MGLARMGRASGSWGSMGLARIGRASGSWGSMGLARMGRGPGSCVSIGCDSIGSSGAGEKAFFLDLMERDAEARVGNSLSMSLLFSSASFS